MGKKIIRPIKGIDVDSAINRRDDNTIYMAKNLRLNNLEDTHLGEYSNIKGTNLVVSDTADYKILKLCKLNDKFILFVKATSGANPDKICQVLESTIPLNGGNPITLDLTYDIDYNVTSNVIIAGEFGFADNVDIVVKTYYESDTVQKIYWTIPGHPLRSLNIIYSDNNTPSAYTYSDLDMSPSVDLSEPIINKTISGNLKCGKIFYGYKLVNNIGAETTISPLSRGYHLTNSLDYTVNDYNYKGGGIDSDSNKGISLTISGTSISKYPIIKLYSIHYIDDVSIPIVSLVYEGNVDSEFIISDTGTPILNISAEEFLLSNGLSIINGQLEIKNNRLFVANYQEEYFDVDEDAVGGYWESRAYRFLPTTGAARLYNDSRTAYVEIPYDTTTFVVSGLTTIHDCVNISNDITQFNGMTLTTNYIYKNGTTTIGASGLNIGISQSSAYSIHPDSVENNAVKWSSPRRGGVSGSLPDPNNGYSSYANPHLAANYKIFKPEEVYRLAIQFKDEKSRYSYPKWICDYKYIYVDTTTTASTGINISIKTHALSVTVNNLPINPRTGSAYEYRIMYVPLTEDDQSVFWGLFSNLFKVTGTSGEYRTCNPTRRSTDTRDDISLDSITEVTQDGKYLEFVSPDYCFGNKKTYVRYNLLSGCNPGSVLVTGNGFGASYSKQYNLYKIYNYDFSTVANKFLTVSSQHDIEYSVDMGAKVSLDGGDYFNRNGETVTNLHNGYRYYSGDNQSMVYGNSNKGRCQIIKPSTSLESSWNSVSIFGCCYVDNFLSRYGGLSYSARTLNKYAPLNNFIGVSGTIAVYGDSYAGLFEYLRQISDNNLPYIADNQTYSELDTEAITTPKQYIPGANEIIIFPTYSRINLKLRSDDYFSKIYTQKGSYLLHEYSGVYEDTLHNDARNVVDWGLITNREEAVFTQKTDLYLYNNTYSREQDLQLFTPKQDSSSIISTFKNRINASDLKLLGETTDSFLKFNPSTYIDVDGQYGEIKALKVFNDRLYFFQEKAIGIVAVNEQATTSIDNETSLVLGNVGLLSRYDYITINNGINDSNHVITSDNYLYGIDEIRKELFRISNVELEKISITKNINSFIKAKDLSGGRIVYNRKYNELLFFYKEPGHSEQQILIFNESQNTFIGTESYFKVQKDSVSLERIDIIDEIILNGDGDVYTLNDGNYNQFNETYYPSEITFLIPSSQEDIVLFNTLEFIMKQVDSGNNLVDFIQWIRIYNNECDTGDLDFATNVESRFGKYRTSKLRNYLGNNERMLSDHIYIKITTKDNTSNNHRVFFRDMIASFSEYNYFG